MGVAISRIYWQSDYVNDEKYEAILKNLKYKGNKNLKIKLGKPVCLVQRNRSKSYNVAIVKRSGLGLLGFDTSHIKKFAEQAITELKKFGARDAHYKYEFLLFSSKTMDNFYTFYC